MPTDGIRYRFGLFEADVQNARLLRQGEPVRLQDQPFLVLIALLERHGEIVTRDELRQRLWPGDTFVEFDKSLGVALTKVRAALGDDASNPRFIETLPRRGYRFIAPVAIDRRDSWPAAASAGSAEPGVAATDSLSASAPVAQPRTAARAPGRDVGSIVLAIAATAVVALTAAGLVYWRHSAAASPASLSLVVAEFQNTTGDSAFDGSLRRAAAVALRQSPFLKITPDAQIGETLQALGRAPTEPVSPGLARDVCQHLHQSAVIDGSVAKDDATYTVVVAASRCDDGAPLARERQTASTKDGVLVALGHALVRVRATLGESRRTLTTFDVPLPVATTESVQALRAFELGMEFRNRGDNVHAIPALETALSVDPQFALAAAQLGSAYSNMGDTERATPYLRRAFELRDHATEPERLYITGRYYDIITGELEKGVETYRLWTRMYPDESIAFNALANDANLIGRYQVAADAAARAVALNPRQQFGQINLMTSLIALGRFDDAKAVIARVLEIDKDNSLAHTARYAIADFKDDAEGREREIAWSTAHGDSGVPYVEAESAARHGRFADCARLFAVVVRSNRAEQNDAAAANALSVMAGFEALAGLDGQARQTVDSALALGARTDTTIGLTAVVNALTGRERDAQALLDAFDRERPLAILNLGIYGPAAHAALAAEGLATADTVTQITAAALPYEMGQEAGGLPAYVRGRAYLAAKAPQLAALEFQKIIDHPEIDPVTPLYAFAQVGLGRAEAAMGHAERARAAYKTFLDLWKDADRDVPLLRAALREYATIRP